MHGVPAVATAVALLAGISGCGRIGYDPHADDSCGGVPPEVDAGAVDAGGADAGTADAGPEGVDYLRILSLTTDLGVVLLADAGDVAGDLIMRWESADAGVLVGRFSDLEAGVPAGPLEVEPYDVTVEPDGRWVIVPMGGTGGAVYRVAVAGDTWIFSLDTADPRTTDGYARQLVHQRLPLPPADTVGRYDLVGIDYADGDEKVPGVCETNMDGTSSFFTETWTIDENWVATVEVDWADYSDPDCAALADSGRETEIALIMESLGSRAALWAWSADDGAGYYLELGVSRTPADLILTRISCRPAGCEADGPVAITLSVRP